MHLIIIIITAYLLQKFPGRFAPRFIALCKFHVRKLWQCLEKMTSSSLKFTIVALIAPKEYCKLKNKFWNASKKSPTSSLVGLQLKLEFYSLWSLWTLRSPVAQGLGGCYYATRLM
ncbi:hypothetical protein Zmor_002700 [Zophobas morio]|uniref:Uncharacterized protein n=1 Tax=Zophobas morio TaxID=2755281 RepID=A0AA38M257_9CUCU|nr:hypothetical protein Zmor_002700 [Zophobas morio]